MPKSSSKSVRNPVQPPWWLELVANVHEAREATNASGAAVALTNGSAGEIICYARRGTMAPEPGMAVLVEDSLTAQCIRSGKQLHCHDAESDTRVCSAAAVNLAARSFVVTPIQQGNQVIGVLAVFSDAPSAFSSMHLARLKTIADRTAGILRDEGASIAGQGLIQLLKKERDEPQPDANRPKPPLSTRAPLSGKEVGREPLSERRVNPVVEQSTEHLPEIPIAKVRTFATFDAVATRKKESTATRLILIVAAALLVIAGSATWTYLKRAKPAPADPPTSIQPAAPEGAEIGTPSADPAPKADTPAQRLSTTEQKPGSGTRTAAERGNATFKQPAADSARSANSLDLGKAKDAAPLSSAQETTPFAGASVVALPAPASDVPQPQQSVQVGSNNIPPPLAAPPDSAAPKPAPLLKTDIVPARLVRSVPPQYPTFARQMRASGTVIVRARVAKDGRLTDLKFLSGPPVLRQAALDAVKLWLYSPATLNGQVVEQEVEIKVNFSPTNK